VEAKESFPGVSLWQDFDKACQLAEAARDLLVEAAKRERDMVVKSDPNWKVHSRERINAAAEARCAEKIKAAEDEFDAACEHAKEKLMKALDERA
jgi:putative heme iron utilization protein